jgi:hypothetical protein
MLTGASVSVEGKATVAAAESLKLPEARKSNTGMMMQRLSSSHLFLPSPLKFTHSNTFKWATEETMREGRVKKEN